LSQNSDGGFQPLDAAQDVSPYSARSMISVSPQTFRMQSGESRVVKVTVGVPASAGDGTRYAILKITSVPVSGNENVGFGTELGVSTLITLTNTKQTHTGSIKDLAVGDPAAGKPLAVTGTIVNTGNTHFGAAPNEVNASATLTNASGSVIATAKTVLSGNSIVPTFGRQFALSLKTGQGLNDGTYHLQADAALQDGTELGQASLDFTVSGGAVMGATGVPTPAAGTTDRSEGSPLVLLAFLAMALLLLLMIVINIVLHRRRRQNRPAVS
jgi:ABC-type Na+ efflux pump permease subunit